MRLSLGRWWPESVVQIRNANRGSIGIFWQTLNANVNTRRSWDYIGVTKTMFQWVAVGGQSFIDQNILPEQTNLLDLNAIAQEPWAQEMIIGLPGIFDEATARSSAASLATLGQQFGQLTFPANVKGFYFPIEIDPTWTAAPEILAPLWASLPRPLYVSVYYGNGIDGAAAADWLAQFIPGDVKVLFQDGVGAFDVSIPLAMQRFNQLRSKFGKRVEMIAECFRVNPVQPAPEGEYFVPATAAEIAEQMAAYRKLPVWMFDGPSYLTNDIIEQMSGLYVPRPPINLTAVKADSGDITLGWQKAQHSSINVVNYTVTIYDFSGNSIKRSVTSTGTQTVYTSAQSTTDFEPNLNFVVFSVTENTTTGRHSEKSVTFASAPTQPAAPTQLVATRSISNDIYMSWEPTVSPAQPVIGHSVKIYNLAGNTVLRTLNIVGDQTYAYYMSDESYADFNAVLTAPVWSVAEVYASGTGIYSAIKSGVIGVDNSHITNAVIFAGQSNAFGHFQDLSADPVLGHSSVTFRKELATKLGVSPAQIAAVNAALGSTAADKGAAVGSYANYWWWDVTTHTPGPCFVTNPAVVPALPPSFQDIVTSLGQIPITAIVWAQGEADVSATDPFAAPAYSTVERYTQATTEIFARMRLMIGNQNLPIWIQTMGHSYWGAVGTPINTIGASYKQYRDAQITIAAADANTKIGAWMPNGDVTDYIEEAGGEPDQAWIHYSKATYHNLATQLAHAIGDNTDRIGASPTWNSTLPPTNFTAVYNASNDVVFSWSPRSGITQYKFYNCNISGTSIIQQTTVTGTSFTFTVAQITAAYPGASDPTMFAYVAEIGADGKEGPPSKLLGSPTSALGAVTNLAAHFSGLDIVYTWDEVPGVSYQLLNNSIVEGSALINDTTLTTNQYTFTEAQQRATYGGFVAGYVDARVRLVNTTTGDTGAYSTVTGQPGADPNPPFSAPTGLTATRSGQNIILSWTDDANANFEFQNKTADTAVVTLTEPTITWTIEQQNTAPGFACAWVEYTVRKVHTTLGTYSAWTTQEFQVP